mmetsp:Transcript_130560/g.194451  ORF Transcript_130560/g.194451 Transcript_130560/m.194451 type:complete len:351 (-) Transcript_130560:71-1123(-)
MTHIIQYVPTQQIPSSMDMFVPKHSMTQVQDQQNFQQQQHNVHAHEAVLRDSIKSQQVENALAVLAQEAGFSQETLSALRQAVETGRKMKERGAVGGQWNQAAQNILSPMPMTPVRLAARTVKPASSKRQQLTVEEAAEIYSLRPRNSFDVLRGSMAHCRTLAPRYGVTPKTIRDVWSGRTWAEATRHLWTEEEVTQRAKRAAMKQSGKKDGSEDDEDEEQAAVDVSANSHNPSANTNPVVGHVSAPIVEAPDAPAAPTPMVEQVNNVAAPNAPGNNNNMMDQPYNNKMTTSAATEYMVADKMKDMNAQKNDTTIGHPVPSTWGTAQENQQYAYLQDRLLKEQLQMLQQR